MRSGRPDASRPRFYLRRFGCSVAESAGAAVSAAAARRRRRRWSCSRRSCRPPCRARRPRRSARWARDSPGHEMPPSAIRRNQTWARDSLGIPSEAAIRRNQTQSRLSWNPIRGRHQRQAEAGRGRQRQPRLIGGSKCGHVMAMKAAGSVPCKRGRRSIAISRHQAPSAMAMGLSLVILSISRRTNFSSRVRTCCTRSAPTHARHPMLANA